MRKCSMALRALPRVRCWDRALARRPMLRLDDIETTSLFAAMPVRPEQPTN